jgi:hypothetical protein
LVLSAQYDEEEGHPLSVFLYALKAPETKRQYPRRLKVFLDFLKLEGNLEQQSKEFLEKAKQNPMGSEFYYSIYSLSKGKSEKGRNIILYYCQLLQSYKAICRNEQ